MSWDSPASSGSDRRSIPVLGMGMGTGVLPFTPDQRAKMKLAILHAIELGYRQALPIRGSSRGSCRRAHHHLQALVQRRSPRPGPSRRPPEPQSSDIVPLDLMSVWEAMEECRRRKKIGLTKSIGVSNFTRKKIVELLDITRIPLRCQPGCLVSAALHDKPFNFSFDEHGEEERCSAVELNPVWQQNKPRERVFMPLAVLLWEVKARHWAETCIPEVALSSSSTTTTRAMPVLGMGTGGYPFTVDGKKKLAIRHAIELGYRHFDTASLYQFEPALGEAIAEALHLGLIDSRSDLFITSKLWCTDAHPDLVLPAIRETLRWNDS
ncbi:hypothetical protein B296_00022549 [Ensete ventricosum]|uniref:NADP-dependent oxidoreductase domain-containing protein n=1 Tax=Ensete ventricosum TaxID=4639 RepID=A0A426XVB8_ENSVE|nr:hypothetical protein B296_00022549 [Ensete ventricosum]